MSAARAARAHKRPMAGERQGSVPSARDGRKGTSLEEPDLRSRSGSIAKSHAEEAILKAIQEGRIPKCESFSGLWFVSESSNRAVGQRCQRWTCNSCAIFKRIAAVYLIQLGIERAQEDKRKIRFITLTDTSAGDMNMRDLYKAWQKLALRLKRRGKLGDYVAVVEAQERGALHMHMLMTDSERGGGFIEQELLSELAAASGFGAVTDIRLVKDSPELVWELGNYLNKTSVGIHEDAAEVGTYVAKANRQEALRDRADKRLRPLRASRGWYPGGLTAAQAELRKLIADPDEGPWRMVWRDPDCENSATAADPSEARQNPSKRR